MGGLGTEIALEVVRLIFGLYALVVMIRFMLQLVRGDFYNPVAEAMVRLTNPLLLPLRRFIPGLWGIDLASVVLLILIKAIELLLILLIAGQSAPLPVIIMVAIVQLLELAIYVLMGAIFVRIIISWINPQGVFHNPAARLAVSLSEPVMRPARRLLPPVSGFDFSPILVILLLGIVLKVLGRIGG